MSTTSAYGQDRARSLGLSLQGRTGPLNAITDVSGVEVGYVTLVEGENVRTGVTAILPRGKKKIGVACVAAMYSLNGNGEMTGTIWIEETGAIAMPIMITNTHAVGTVHRGVIDWINQNNPKLAAQWLLPVVAETWDGFLNDINGAHIKTEHASSAIDNATSGPVVEGSVGGGTGMNCYGFKGGNGTSSRLVKYANEEYVVAAFVQANFGSRAELRITGVDMHDLNCPNPLNEVEWFIEDQLDVRPPAGAGSVIVIIATDAPLMPAQCKALAKRVPLGLARTGTAGSHFSGDIFLAFSTANEGALNSGFPTQEETQDDYDQMKSIQWGRMDSFYTAAVQAVEEAVLNALLVNHDMTGRNGHKSFALPHNLMQAKLKEAGKI